MISSADTISIQSPKSPTCVAPGKSDLLSDLRINSSTTKLWENYF